jgi:hypothetical protein
MIRTTSIYIIFLENLAAKNRGIIFDDLVIMLLWLIPFSYLSFFQKQSDNFK